MGSPKALVLDVSGIDGDGPKFSRITPMGEGISAVHSFKSDYCRNGWAAGSVTLAWAIKDLAEHEDAIVQAEYTGGFTAGGLPNTPRTAKLKLSDRFKLANDDSDFVIWLMVRGMNGAQGNLNQQMTYAGYGSGASTYLQWAFISVIGADGTTNGGSLRFFLNGGAVSFPASAATAIANGGTHMIAAHVKIVAGTATITLYFDGLPAGTGTQAYSGAMNNPLASGNAVYPMLGALSGGFLSNGINGTYCRVGIKRQANDTENVPVADFVAGEWARNKAKYG